MREYMKRYRNDNILWLFLFVLTDLFFAFLLWISSSEQFSSMLIIIILFTLAVMTAGCYFSHKQCAKHIVAEVALQEQRLAKQLNDKELELQSYREFIEEWVHEIKTPLSLGMMVLENRRDEMTPYVYNRMEHMRRTIESDVEKILYYSRLSAAHADYEFELIRLADLIKEKLEEYKLISDEKHVHTILNLSDVQVVSDRRVLTFMISQVLNNAFKYTAQNGSVQIESREDIDEGCSILAIRNNGSILLSEDKPFIFDKGFTGNQPKRQKATGMGLYFVNKYAEMLSIKIELEENAPSGYTFGIRFMFPYVM